MAKTAAAKKKEAILDVLKEEKKVKEEEKKVDLSRIEQVKRMLEQAMNAKNPRILLGVWHVTDADVVCSEIATINFPRGDFQFALKSLQSYVNSEMSMDAPEPLPPADLNAITNRLSHLQQMVHKATEDANTVQDS